MDLAVEAVALHKGHYGRINSKRLKKIRIGQVDKGAHRVGNLCLNLCEKNFQKVLEFAKTC